MCSGNAVTKFWTQNFQQLLGLLIINIFFLSWPFNSDVDVGGEKKKL